MGDKEKSLDVLRAYVKDYPGNDEVTATLARVLKRTDNLAESKELYTGLLKKDGSNHDWHAELADICYQLGELDEALLHLEFLYKENEENVAANLGFLKIHIARHEIEKATPYVQFLRENHPDIYDFNIYAGLYCIEKQDREEGVVYFQKAIELDASKALPYYHVGLLQVQKGEFASACDNWKKALLLSPEEVLAKKIKHCLKITVELSEFLSKET
jgi:tetratricopeptide (TPR) repeat protein